MKGHRTWDRPVPVSGPNGVETHYVGHCECGWRQPTPTAKTSHAWRARQRHIAYEKQRLAEAARGAQHAMA